MPLSQHNLDFQQLKVQIYRYSLQIVSNKWEAEVLSQDALIKIYRLMESSRNREFSNAYLYTIVLNTWKDRQRQNNYRLEHFNANHPDTPDIDTQLITRELLEVLAHRLPPRDMVVLMLMDIFDFTAKETAELLSSAEGTIQVALGRARLRLKKLAHSLDLERSMPLNQHMPAQLNFDALVEAFRARDPAAICHSYIGLVKQHMKVSQLSYKAGKLTFTFEDPDGNRFLVTA